MPDRSWIVVGALAAGALVAGCDTRAETSASASGPADPARLSREHESCGTTLHCADGLRCFDNECRRTDRSVLGDYYAELGTNRRAGGDTAGALTAYAEALKMYEAAGIAVPVDVECGYGAALVDARADKERAELAARVLHRCVLGAPSGSTLREAALRQAAVLDDSGLDPAHLSRDQPADVYLSRAPARPKTDTLEVTVAASPEPSAKGWPVMAEAIQGLRGPLVECWEKNYAAKKDATLSVVVPMRSDYKDSGYDDEPGYYLTQIDPKAPAAAGPAAQCVRDAIAAAAKGVKGSGSWQAAVTVTVK